MQEALPCRQALVMCYVIQSERPKGAPDRWSSHGGWLHEVLLRRKEMRSSIGGTRVWKGCWDKRCLCSEGLCLCFICWQDMQLSALCQQRVSIKRSMLHLGTPAAALMQGDATHWPEARQVCCAGLCLPPAP